MNNVIKIWREDASGNLFRFIGECADGTTKVLRARASKPYRFASVIDLPTGGELVSFHSSQPVAPNGVRVLPIAASVAVAPPAMAVVSNRVVPNPAATAAVAQPAPAPAVTASAPVKTNEEIDKEVEAAIAEKFPEIAEKFNTPQSLSTVPYVAQNGEVEDLIAALEAGENVLLTGPTGCGKTHLVSHAITKIQTNGLVTVQGMDGLTVDELIGYRDVVEVNGVSVTMWRDGLITDAVRNGKTLYCDEPNALPDGVRFALFSAMDDRRELTLAQNGGEVVKAAAGFNVVASMNEGAGYSGTSMLNFAFRGRYHTIIELGYLPMKREADLLAKRTGLAKPECLKLAKVAHALRDAQEAGEIKLPVGTRALLACASKMARGIPALKAATLSIINQVPSTAAAERKAVQDLFSAHYATNAAATPDVTSN